jgi:hypothetical protein
VGIAVALLPDAGAPQVGVTITGLHATTPSTISVQTSTPGANTWQTVRGADHLVVTGGVFVRDFVPPLNVATTYHLIVHAGPTTPTPTEATITVASLTAWVQDPLNPTAAVAVDCWGRGRGVSLLADSFEDLTRAQPVDAVTVQGARLPVASVGTRQAPSRVQVHLRANLATQDTLAASLRALLDNAGTLVLRGLPATIPLDPVAHVVAAVVESPVVGSLLGERDDWQLDVTQVVPTSMTVAVPWWTYAQVVTLWAGQTYTDAKNARPGTTYLDWARDPRRP